MMLFSPAPCENQLRLGVKQTHNFTPASRRLSLPAWPSRSLTLPPTPRLRRKSDAQPRSPRKSPKTANRPVLPEMSSFPLSPRFSPTLRSIPEVFEYEPLETTLSRKTSCALQNQDEAFSLEPSNLAEPTLSRATSRSAIIQSPSRKSLSTSAVSKTLRKILDADRVRRRRILRVYLKAIVFLKYLWNANERYGSAMGASGMCMR